MSCVNIHVIEAVAAPTLAPPDVGMHWINTVTGAMWQSNGTATVANWVKVDADTDVKVKVSAADTTAGFLNDELTVSVGTNATLALEKSITSPAADEKLNIQLDQTKLSLTASQTTDFTEAAQDAVAAALVAGGGISIVYNDAGNAITVAATSSFNSNTFRWAGHFLNELRHNLVDASAGVPVIVSPALLVADTTFTSILVLGFDDATSEGLKFGTTIPTGVTSINFRYTSKPRTAPAGAVAVNTALYTRRFADNVAAGAWSAAVNLGTLAFAANLNMRLHTQTVTLATLGVVAGEFVDFELIRRGADASDTLVGDWNLVEIAMFFA